MSAPVPLTRNLLLFSLLVLLPLFVAGCQPTATGNVLGYLLAQRTGRLQPAAADAPRGALVGVVTDEALRPIAGAVVVVAERTGAPHVAYTGADGRYRIERVPAGQYAPAAVAPGFAEQTQQNSFGMPTLVTIRGGEQTEAPPFRLQPLQVPPLPQPWPQAAALTLTATGIVTAPFPTGSRAQVQAFTFVRDGVLIDTLRLYLPTLLEDGAHLPMLFMVYPTDVDLWQSVSAAYAGQGYGLVAISPAGARGTAINDHAADAYWALMLARDGALSPDLRGQPAVALGGSFSSAILHQLVRISGDAIAGWVTVGGIGNAFAGAADFYAGQLELPPGYEYLIPALGMPNLYPLLFLRYSPVYTATELPPTLIIHTDADRVIPITQAYELETALRRAGVPVDVFYYDDVSHYLQIDEYITDAGKAMFFRTLDFADRILRQGTHRRE